MECESRYEGLSEKINRLGFENDRIRTEFQAIVNECRNQYHSMLDSVDALIILVNSDLKIIWANRNTRKLFGSDTIGESCSRICQGKGKECREISGCLVKNAFARGEVNKYETQMTGTNGKKIYISGSARVISRNGNGKPTAVVCVLSDITERKKTERELKESMLQLRNNLAGTIKAMAMTVETRDPYTAGHQRKTADIARLIGQEMGLPSKQVDGIRMAGVIHDLGKISIPAEILSKPGKICNAEYSLIKFHPKTGYDILNGIDFRWPVADIVLQHHERMDGSGYPSGLAGDKILLEARIIGVADVIEAMSSHRPYRPALGINKAFSEIRENSGRLYDSDVVAAAESLFARKEYLFH
ncbi:MAG: HD domain-containing phosphohydrolase [Desulfobulbaceae bacterium]|nr:HD domain-containing phosphohydrolase [Desulfobulbaceae bacterium]